MGIAVEIERFMRNVEGLRSSVGVSMSFAEAAFRAAGRTMNEFLEEFGNGGEGGDYEIPRARVFQASRIAREAEERERALFVLPRSFFVALVSQYDAFLGRLLRAIFLARPDLLTGSQRQISLTELLAFDSLEAAREYFLEKEIEGVLRESHSTHFDWMERRFGIELRKGLDSWPAFVEMTERRNLFVHTDGVISSQYIEVCKKHGVLGVETQAVGAQLEMDADYFFRSFDTLVELAVKLGQVLWRKLLPKETALADVSLIDTAYELLQEGRYAVGEKILAFFCGPKVKLATEENRRILIVNHALFLKFSGQPDRCLEVVRAHDWSASAERFRLAIAVLEDRQDDALSLLKNAVRSGAVQREHVDDWPLFRDLRKHPSYVGIYEEIFGERPSEDDRFRRIQIKEEDFLYGRKRSEAAEKVSGGESEAESSEDLPAREEGV